MDSYEEFKTFYISNIILFIILLFVILYIVINWELVYNGNYLGGEIVKPILITGILFLIFHLIMTWDDDDSNNNYDKNFIGETEESIPKFKLGNNQATAQNEIVGINAELPKEQLGQNAQNVEIPQSLSNKYVVMNKANRLGKFNKLGQSLTNSHSHTHTDNTKSNQNIFISHKNSSKYGIKFI